MAVQPIDLQTMYSQMSNLAQRVSHEQSSAQLSQAVTQQTALNQDMQKAQSVQKAAENESKTGQLKEDGKGNGTVYSQAHNGKPKHEEQNEAPEKHEIREEYLGQHINITR